MAKRGPEIAETFINAEIAEISEPYIIGNQSDA
jgi:hypothetical protein